MARKRIYNHTRFDGGMTHNKRDTSDLTKLGLISHLDIYRNRNEMFVMPGFVSDMAYDGSSTGLKVYDPQAFGTLGTDRIFVLTKKSDGTGSKIFERLLSGTEWDASTTYPSFNTEGTNDLIDYPFFWFAGADFHYPVKNAGATTVARHGANAADYTASWQSWLTFSIPTGRTYQHRGFNGTWYLTKGGAASGISSITSSAVTENAKTTSITPQHISSGNYQIGIVGTNTLPRRSQILLWDAASSLIDQNILLGKGSTMVVGYPSGIWASVGVSASTDLESNGKDEMSVRIIQGETPDTFYNLQTVSVIDQTTDIFALNDTYQDSMLWYARPEIVSGERIQGIWALGRGEVNSQFGVSVLLDTSSLGLVRNAHMFGYSMYFIHNSDGSVSRLDDYQTGTYDVPATIETLIYGADTPYLKELNGLSITTENLPSGGSIVCYYRTDEDSSWTTMGTSSTADTKKHSFTKAAGTPIGRFQEIQFKLVITGKISVKNIMIAITETDELPF